ncbi:hypothetical protein D104_11995 [Marinomonas profundimaris]|jgi:hypothetical protein|uniref:Uncharacterized protein n=1 Tax=Marinomonas profundimaris TaxID=1208321 RepID=W1RQZ9_9GAMM|nr:hypothetical protein D104_11995 [Marinomonas profundimaris]|tara:strand:- start:4992 stop:5123 length:132 start_codon:yes stop_codon:yes gene_type:complete
MDKWNDETNGDDILEVYENLDLDRFLCQLLSCKVWEVQMIIKI